MSELAATDFIYRIPPNFITAALSKTINESLSAESPRDISARVCFAKLNDETENYKLSSDDIPETWFIYALPQTRRYRPSDRMEDNKRKLKDQTFSVETPGRVPECVSSFSYPTHNSFALTLITFSSEEQTSDTAHRCSSSSCAIRRNLSTRSCSATFKNSRKIQCSAHFSR